MIAYIAKRLVLVVPVVLAVALVCFLLVHIAPGDPLVSVLPPDASAQLAEQMRRAYGFDRPLPVQFGIWLWNALQRQPRHLDRHRPLGGRGGLARGRQHRDARRRRGVPRLRVRPPVRLPRRLLPRLAGSTAWSTTIAITGVSMPHYWLGMVLVIVFSVQLGWLPAVGAGPGGWAWDWEHIKHLILPAVTMSVIPMGIVTRTVRALVGDLLSQEFVLALRAKGLSELRVFAHVAKNAAPTAIAVMGLQLGYLLGGSILIETVFSWPGTGFLLNAAIFQRDLPLLQGTILVLALFFVFLNLLVDVIQAAIDPRIKRS